MSGEIRSLQFGMTTRDIDHWPADYLAEAEACGCDSYASHPQHQIQDAMLDAAARFVAVHPDVFACEVT